MKIGGAILGLIIGAVVGAMNHSILLGAVGGAIIGHLLSRLGQFERRLQNLEFPPRKPDVIDTPAPATSKTSEEPVEPHPWYDTDEFETIPPTGPDQTPVSHPEDNKPGERLPKDEWESSWDDPVYRSTPSLEKRV